MLKSVNSNMLQKQLNQVRKLYNQASVPKKKLPALPSDWDHIPVSEYLAKSPSVASVFGWGLGQHGGLGHYLQNKKKMTDAADPRFRIFNRPFRMVFGETHTVTDIATGYGFSAFAVKRNDQQKVFGTGLNSDSQIGYQCGKNGEPLEMLLWPMPIHLGLNTPKKTKVIGLSAGRAHLIVNTDNEGAFTLGNNAYGQCGRSVIQDENYLGSRIVHRIPHLGGEKIKAVECGQDHTLFLTESGKVYSCGWGADGQTGLGHYNIEPHPQRVLGDIEGENIIKISSKCDSVLAINDKGDVFGWGNSEYGQLFDKTDSQQQVNRPMLLKKCQGLGKIVDVAAAGSFCIMLNDAGDVYTWGYGILGRGPEVLHCWTPDVIPPVLFGRNKFQPQIKVTSVYCGLNYSGAITNNGSIYVWGKNKDCCLGIVEKHDQFFPLKVYIGAVAKKLAFGVDHSLALCYSFGGKENKSKKKQDEEETS